MQSSSRPVGQRSWLCSLRTKARSAYSKKQSQHSTFRGQLRFDKCGGSLLRQNPKQRRSTSNVQASSQKPSDKLPDRGKTYKTLDTLQFWWNELPKVNIRETILEAAFWMYTCSFLWFSLGWMAIWLLHVPENWIQPHGFADFALWTMFIASPFGFPDMANRGMDVYDDLADQKVAKREAAREAAAEATKAADKRLNQAITMQRSPVRALGGLFNKQRAEQQEVGDRNVAKAAAAAAMASVNEELVEAKLARDCSNEVGSGRLPWLGAPEANKVWFESIQFEFQKDLTLSDAWTEQRMLERDMQGHKEKAQMLERGDEDRREKARLNQSLREFDDQLGQK